MEPYPSFIMIPPNVQHVLPVIRDIVWYGLSHVMKAIYAIIILYIFMFFSRQLRAQTSTGPC